jgi:hypothetical protein
MEDEMGFKCLSAICVTLRKEREDESADKEVNNDDVFGRYAGTGDLEESPMSPSIQKTFRGKTG